MIRRLLLLAMVIALAACVSPPEQRAEALVQGERFLEMGVQAFRADDYANAATHFTHALGHYQGLDHQDGMLRSRINLAETALAVGRAEAAERHLRAAQPLAGAAADAARVQLLLSSAALMRGRLDEAAALLAPLLDGPAHSAALRQSALANRVAIALARHDDDPAPWVERYAAAVRGQAAPAFVARLHRFEAELARRGGDPAVAAARLQQALDIYKDIPSRGGTAATLEEWGALLVAQQRWDEAEMMLQRALHIRLWLLARAETAADLRQLATINEAAGRSQRAAAQRRWADIVAGGGRLDWGELQREVLPY